MNEHYSRDHIWIRRQGDHFRVGLSAFAQKELGEIVFVELPQIGKRVKKGESVCSIDSLKSTSDIYAPVGGTVVETNPRTTENNAAIVNKDPLGEGWLFAMTVDDTSELEALLSTEQYEAFVS